MLVYEINTTSVIVPAGILMSVIIITDGDFHTHYCIQNISLASQKLCQ